MHYMTKIVSPNCTDYPISLHFKVLLTRPPAGPWSVWPRQGAGHAATCPAVPRVAICIHQQINWGWHGGLTAADSGIIIVIEWHNSNCIEVTILC